MNRLFRRERRKGASPHYQGPKRRREDREEQRHGAGPDHDRRRLGDYLWAHRQALGSGLVRMRRNPLATWLTILVLGITLALPTALDLVVDHLAELGDHWRQGADISLFLEPERDDAEARRLMERLADDAEIAALRLITRAEALETLQRQLQLGDALALLGENPLPAVIVVRPASGDPAAQESLRRRLAQLPGVEVAQQDTQWVQRLQALLQLAARAATLLGLFSILAVALIVGNTLRLMGQSYTEELRVSRLLGATDAYLRRPFLYTGLIYGLAGAGAAWALIQAGLWWLAPAVRRLNDLYQSSFQLHGPDSHALLLLGLGGPVLTLVTAHLVIQRQIRHLERD